MFKIFALAFILLTFNFAPIGDYTPDRLIIVRAHGCIESWFGPCTPDTTWPGGSPLTIYHVIFSGEGSNVGVWGAIDPQLEYYVPIGLIEWCVNLDFYGVVSPYAGRETLFRECP